MRDFIYDLKYYCSASNKTSRGFYLMCAALLILLPIATISGAIACVIYAMASNWQWVPCIIAIVALVVWIWLIWWLKKS